MVEKVENISFRHVGRKRRKDGRKRSDQLRARVHKRNRSKGSIRQDGSRMNFKGANPLHSIVLFIGGQKVSSFGSGEGEGEKNGPSDNMRLGSRTHHASSNKDGATGFAIALLFVII